jgi:release factor glutamine methyltransferase
MREMTVTIAEALADAAVRLSGAGIEDGPGEALRLWAALEGCAPGAVYLARRESADPERAARFECAVARRAAGEPLAYVSGVMGFRHLDLTCDSRALIPRPETEGLVDLVLSRIRQGRACDIGTGTGCIALALAQEGAFASVVAVDRSADALALAAVNARRTGVAVHLVQGNFLDAIATGSMDLVVSNPPYLTEAEYEALDGSVRAWEPAMALVSGPDGLAATGALLRDARRVLRPGGWMGMEIDSRRGAESAAAAGTLGWGDIAVVQDLFGRERYLLARRSEA